MAGRICCSNPGLLWLWRFMTFTLVRFGVTEDEWLELLPVWGLLILKDKAAVNLWDCCKMRWHRWHRWRRSRPPIFRLSGFAVWTHQRSSSFSTFHPEQKNVCAARRWADGEVHNKIYPAMCAPHVQNLAFRRLLCLARWRVFNVVSQLGLLPCSFVLCAAGVGLLVQNVIGYFFLAHLFLEVLGLLKNRLSEDIVGLFSTHAFGTRQAVYCLFFFFFFFPNQLLSYPLPLKGASFLQ